MYNLLGGNKYHEQKRQVRSEGGAEAAYNFKHDSQQRSH